MNRGNEMSYVGSTRRSTTALSLVVLMLLVTDGSAFETPTHRRINEAAAGGSPVLDQFLRNELNLLSGIGEPLRGQAVIDWIGLGGVAEDQFFGSGKLGGVFRSPKHFHTPLRSWELAGLQGTNEASVRWAQDPGQSTFPSQQAAWADARAAFFRAATARTDSDRQQAYANAFRILGQLMHLVADLASPAHTRDESHAPGDNFEKFMGAGENQGRIAGYKTFDRSIVQASTGDLVATVPIARIWDTDRYTGVNPPDEAASPMFGLAEFTSANFFSTGTISATAFADPVLPLPARNVLDLAFIEPYITGEMRQYYGKSGRGVPVVHMVAERAVHRLIPPLLQNEYVLDDLVFRDYAAHLLPRAIGYSSGLLDYFFRGQLEIAPPDRFVYGLAPYLQGNTGTFTTLRLKARNATTGENTSCPTGQQCPAPQLIAVVQYRTPPAGTSLIETPGADLSQQLFFAVSQPLPVAPGSSFGADLVFDFSAGPIPTNAADVFLTVVYRGPLGLEADAVMVGGKDLFEPDPLDRGNITDYDCFAGQLRYVVDLPPYHYPDDTERDVNQDGIQDLFGPGLETGLYVKAFDLSEPFPSPSDGNFDFKNTEMAAAQYTRFMLLQDKPTYGAVVLDRQIQDVSTGFIFENSSAAFAVDGVVNDVVRGPQGQVVRRITQSFPYRDVPTFHLIFLYNPNTAPCLPQTQFLTPPLRRIDGVLPAE